MQSLIIHDTRIYIYIYICMICIGSFNENLPDSQRGMTADYERLEFLGDSVLKLIIGTQLYKEHPGWTEGHLTQVRVLLSLL